MNGLAERIGYPQLIQIIIEFWNEIFLLILIIMMLIGKRRDSRDEAVRIVKIPFTWELVVFYGATFLYNLFDILNIVSESLPSRAFRNMFHIGVFGYYAVGGSMTVFYLQVIKHHVAKKLNEQALSRLISVFQLLQISLYVMLAVTPFTGLLYRFTDTNEYERTFGYNVWQAVTILIFAVIGSIVIAKWRRIDRFVKEIVIIVTVFSIIGVVSGIFMPLSMNNIMVAVAALVSFLMYETNKTNIIIKRTRELESARAELAESRLTMMLAQIKPHFIYNSMNAIMELCYTDPELAANTIAHFSDYLRGKLKAFDDNSMTWFDEELELIMAYLQIEYADRNKVFRVEYHLAYMDFRLPALTVQPIVENAVKHGIDRYSADSLVEIRSFEVDENIFIEIIDNGTAEQGDDSLFAESRGIGLKNAAERLRMMCGGEITVMHNENGTKTTITIPKKEQEENRCIR